jgi:mono/diheme cytochrome c family protein
MKKLLLNAALIIAVTFLFGNCGGSGSETENVETTPKPRLAGEDADPMENKGIGPVKSLNLPDAIDQAMAAEGSIIYVQYCTSCHKPGEKFIGPAPKDVLTRRSPEWIMNMILNPEQMVKEDPIAKKLLVEYNMAPMANQNLTEEQARKILEYFRTL